ncbi:MAG: DNA-processing protein DprA [Christensenellales bacterium]
MKKEEKILIWLDKFEFLTYKKRVKLFDALEHETFFENFISSYDKLKNIISYSQFVQMQIDLTNVGVDNYIASIQKKGIKLVTLCGEEYPENLKNIAEEENPPLVLYCKGDTSLLDSGKNINIAIVGTRKPTNYGKQITEKFARELTENGFNIVSGLADGVDTISHKACLESGGKTIAVLAGGLDKIYPILNTKLSEEIAKTGLLVTEKPPSYSAQNYDFPMRNRIIAGLSSGVLITEAGLKSGTMHTKEYALEFGKELFVVPGNITSSQSEGCNCLIKSMQGTIVLSVDDILEVFNKPKHKIAPKTVQLSLDEAMIFEILKDGEQTFDEILLKTNFDVKTLTNLLTSLLIRGIIKKLAGNTYSL